MNPVRWVRSRFRRWWQSRLQSTDKLVLHQRNVYIVPTVPGLVLAVTLLVLLITSINFQLSLGYALTFLLAGCALVAMHRGHATLRGLELYFPAQPPQTLGSANLHVHVHNPSAAPRYGLGLAFVENDTWMWSEIAAHHTNRLQLAWHAPRRGWVDIPPITLETRFPMGVFRAWTVWRPASKVLVYPAPEVGGPGLPVALALARAGAPAARSMPSDPAWDGLRPYRRGDPRKTLAWKSCAKAMASGSDALVSRERAPVQAAPLYLDYANTGLADKEARLSRLCAWARRAETLGLAYGLRLPHAHIEPGSGPLHLGHCLEAMALC